MNPQEHAEVWGGYKVKNIPFKKLPLGCCALSLSKFQNPVCSPQGHVFEASKIIPFLKKIGNKNPVDGTDLSGKDLKPVYFAENGEGE